MLTLSGLSVRNPQVKICSEQVYYLSSPLIEKKEENLVAEHTTNMQYITVLVTMTFASKQQIWEEVGGDISMACIGV